MIQSRRETHCVNPLTAHLVQRHDAQLRGVILGGAKDVGHHRAALGGIGAGQQLLALRQVQQLGEQRPARGLALNAALANESASSAIGRGASVTAKFYSKMRHSRRRVEGPPILLPPHHRPRAVELHAPYIKA